MALRLKHVLDKAMRARFMPEHFTWPDRDGLIDIVKYELKKRVTTFNNYYGTTFIGRQEKVVRHQVGQLASFKLASFNALPSTKKPTKNAIRGLCTGFVVSGINRWSGWTDHEFATEWEKSAGAVDYLIRDHKPASTRLLHSPTTATG